MLIHLFTIGGHELKGSQIGLLPGIPQSLLIDPQIGGMAQGSPLLLRFPDGRQVKTKLTHYYLNLPTTDANEDLLRSLPLIPVLPPEIGIAMLPVGTRVYLEAPE